MSACASKARGRKTRNRRRFLALRLTCAGVGVVTLYPNRGVVRDGQDEAVPG